MNKENLNELLRKVLFGLVGIFAPLTVRYVQHLNERVETMSLQLARIEQILKIQEPIAHKVEQNGNILLRLEATVQAQDRRIERLESKQ